MLLAMLPARLVVPRAEPARFEAWLNLSHLEKARVFIIVRAKAMTVQNDVSTQSRRGRHAHEVVDAREPLTNQRQPENIEARNRQNGHGHPQRWLDIHCQPEEATIGGIDDLCSGLAALKHPFRVSRGGIYFVPPAQPNKAAASNVLEVVEVGR